MDDAETTRSATDQYLEVDRAEFVMRLSAVAGIDGVGRMPITLHFNGEELVLTYGCVIRIKASGNWPEDANFSKAELKRFIKRYQHPRSLNAAGFVRRLSNPKTDLLLARQDDATLLIDGHPLACNWAKTS